MQTHFFTSKPIPVTELFNGRLFKYNVREVVTIDTTPTCRFLNDQYQNRLTVIADELACATCLLVCDLNQNKPWIILSAIADEFACDISS
jgi:hypothetical protein